MNCVIIDDDPIQHTILSQYIEEIEDIECTGFFKNPIEFLKVQNKHSFDFIILDVEMPKMSGVDLLESFTSPINVLVMSSKSQYAIEVINHNVLGYLLKPVKFVDLPEEIYEVEMAEPFFALKFGFSVVKFVRDLGVESGFECEFLDFCH